VEESCADSTISFAREDSLRRHLETLRMVGRPGDTMAELRGWTQFIGLQIEYSLIERTVSSAN